MDQNTTITTPITDSTEQSHTQCPNKGTQDLDSEKVTDGSNESGVDDNFDPDKHITKRTPHEIREKLGFDSEDVHDGLIELFTSCVGLRSKTRRQEEDNETYGFSDMESREKMVIGRLSRQLSDRRSRRSKHTAKKYSRSKSQEDVNRCMRDKPKIDPDVYSFTYSERGYLVNIVNDRFIGQEDQRDGAHLDLLNMKEIGRKFGFHLFNNNYDKNLTKEQTMSLLTRIQNADHSRCDCFMFMISTHGLEQRNPALRGEMDHALVCADDKLIFKSTILNMFNDSNCPTLKGKPKIFFIQACRGEKLDHGSDVYVVSPRKVNRTDTTIVRDRNSRPRCLTKEEFVDEYDTHPGQDSWVVQHGMTDVQNPPLETSNTYCQNRNQDFRSQFSTENALRNNYTAMNVPFSPAGGAYIPRLFPRVDTPSLRCSNDMLVMYAIPQGYFAWRSNADGSWLIHYLHQVLMSYDMKTPKNFLSLLTKVSAKMSLREAYIKGSQDHTKKAIPVIEHKLDKDILFQPKG